MDIPSRQECFKLLEKYKVPKPIVGHSEQVAKVAVYLGRAFAAGGEEINIPLLEASALLHDIDKMLCIEDGEKKHAFEGFKILEKEGFPEIAAIVREHRVSHILEARFSCIESKLLYYSDKRVKHEKIVSLGKRYEYLFERYGSISEEAKQRLVESKPLAFALEKEIFEKIKEKPDMGGLQ